MFAHRSENKSELSTKRLTLIRDIQNTDRQSIKKRARSHMVHLFSLQRLQQLVAKLQNEFKKEDIAQLVKYSNAQFPLAVVCLGNLLLDGKVKVCQLEQQQLKPGYHPNWLWLIEVLVQNKYCTPQLLQHCIKSLSQKRSIQTRRRALIILYKLTACNMHPKEWITDLNILLSIFNCCLNHHKVSQIAFGLLHELLSKSSEQDLANFSTAIIAQKIVQILTQGSFCNIRKLKMLSCKIITQLSSKLLFLPAIQPVVIRLLIQAKTNAYVECALEMIKTTLDRASEEDILTLIEQELITVLGILKQALMDEDYEEYIVFKIVELGRQIESRTKEGQNSKGVHRQLKRFKLLSITDKMDIY